MKKRFLSTIIVTLIILLIILSFGNNQNFLNLKNGLLNKRISLSNSETYDVLYDSENQIMGIDDYSTTSQIRINGRLEITKVYAEINDKLTELEDFQSSIEQQPTGEDFTKITFKPWWLLTKEDGVQNVKIYLKDSSEKWWFGKFKFTFDSTINNIPGTQSKGLTRQSISQEEYSKTIYKTTDEEILDNKISLSPGNEWTFKPKKFIFIIPTVIDPPSWFNEGAWLAQELEILELATSTIDVQNGVRTVNLGERLSDEYKYFLSQTNWDEPVRDKQLFEGVPAHYFFTLRYPDGDWFDFLVERTNPNPISTAGAYMKKEFLFSNDEQEMIEFIEQRIRNTHLAYLPDDEDIIFIIAFKNMEGLCGWANVNSGYIYISTSSSCNPNRRESTNLFLHELGHIFMLGHQGSLSDRSNRNLMGYGILKTQLPYHQALHSLARMFGTENTDLKWGMNKMLGFMPEECGDGFIVGGEECEMSTIYGQGDYKLLSTDWRKHMSGINEPYPPRDGAGFFRCIDNNKERTPVTSRKWPIGQDEQFYPHCALNCKCIGPGVTVIPDPIPWDPNQVILEIPNPGPPIGPGITTPPESCGNGIVEPARGEECDPFAGGTGSVTGCTTNEGYNVGYPGIKSCSNGCKWNACSSPLYCGDGAITTPPEACDDGNFISGDGCSSDCKIETCGCGYYLEQYPQGVVLIENCGVSANQCGGSCTIRTGGADNVVIERPCVFNN